MGTIAVEAGFPRTIHLQRATNLWQRHPGLVVLSTCKTTGRRRLIPTIPVGRRRHGRGAGRFCSLATMGYLLCHDFQSDRVVDRPRLCVWLPYSIELNIRSRCVRVLFSGLERVAREVHTHWKSPSRLSTKSRRHTHGQLSRRPQILFTADTDEPAPRRPRIDIFINYGFGPRSERDKTNHVT